VGIQPKQLCIAICLALAAQTAIAAECRIDEVPADQIAPPQAAVAPAPAPTPTTAPASRPTTIVLQLSNATAEQAIEALNRVAGTTIALDPSRKPSGPVVVYDFDIQAATPSEAIEQASRQMHTGVIRRRGKDGTDDTMVFSENGVRAPALSGPNRRRGERAGVPPTQPRASITGVELWNSLTGDPKLGYRTLNVKIEVVSAAAGASGYPRVEVTEAVDEQGRALTPTEERGSRPGPERMQGPVTISAKFGVPSPLPARFKRFRADVVIDVPRTFERLTVTGIADTPVECELSGVKLRIGPTYVQDNRRLIDISLPGKIVNLNMDKRPAWVDALDAIVVTGPAGESLRLTGGGGSRQGEWWVNQMQVLGPRDARDREKPVPPPTPATLVWSVIKSTQALRVPVSADDLRIP